MLRATNFSAKHCPPRPSLHLSGIQKFSAIRVVDGAQPAIIGISFEDVGRSPFDGALRATDEQKGLHDDQNRTSALDRMRLALRYRQRVFEVLCDRFKRLPDLGFSPCDLAGLKNKHGVIGVERQSVHRNLR